MRETARESLRQITFSRVKIKEKLNIRWPRMIASLVKTAEVNIKSAVLRTNELVFTVSIPYLYSLSLFPSPSIRISIWTDASTIPASFLSLNARFIVACQTSCALPMENTNGRGRGGLTCLILRLESK